MTADLWMGIAIGLLGSWAFLVVVLASMQTGRQNAKLSMEDANQLLRDRNMIGQEQCDKLAEISVNLELINDTLKRKGGA